MPYLANASIQAMGDALVDRIDTGGAGTIQIRSGTRPVDGDAAATGTLLATLTFSATAFGATSSAGVATASAITSDSSADNTGTATWARVLNGSAAPVMDLSVGTSAAEVILDSVSIVAGGTVSITSMTVTQPDGT